MRSYKTEGIILKRTNFGEADKILTIFTKRHGKIKVLAKGIRRITSRRSPNVELFNCVTLFVHQGKTFDILTEAQVSNTFSSIRKNLELVGLAYYICELVDGLCAEHQPQQRVYELLLSTLNELDHGLIQKFESTLLFELGFLPASPAGGQGGPAVSAQKIDTTAYIENLLERRIKSKKFLTTII